MGGILMKVRCWGCCLEERRVRAAVCTDPSFTCRAGRGLCGEYSTIENSQVWISNIQQVMDHLHAQTASELRRGWETGFKWGKLQSSEDDFVVTILHILNFSYYNLEGHKINQQSVLKCVCWKRAAQHMSEFDQIKLGSFSTNRNYASVQPVVRIQ